MAAISLCMIVRDEEAMLAGALASAREAVDDIVVVDTGSRDGTKQLATSLGARVFDFTWCDDFSAARNEALRHARGRWVLVLDADERLAPAGAARLRSVTDAAKFDCGMLRLHDAARIDSSFDDVISGRERLAEVQLVPRLLRRGDGLKFVDPIHENVGPWLRRRGMKLSAVNADIVHLGATEQVVLAKSKTSRNIRLLRIRLERDPGDLAAYGYLAHDLLRAGAPDEAFEATEQGWRHIDRAGSGVDSGSIHRLATARAYLLIARGRFADARETARLARSVEGENPDFIFLEANANECEALASPATRRELLTAARDGYARCLEFADRVFAQVFVFGASTWCGSIRLGTMEILLGRPTEALRAFEAALARRPDDKAALLGRAEALIDGGDPAAALRRIEPLLDAASPDGWTLAAAAVRALGLAGDARLFTRRARAIALAGNGFVSTHRRLRLHELTQRLVSPPTARAGGES